jgi:hypothetical protein
MRKRSSRRLAGCIAIELLLLGSLTAAPYFEYQAGSASSGAARALVIEDRHHHQAVIINVDFSTPLSVSDHIGALAAKAYGLDRSALIIHSTREGEPAPQDAVNAIGAAVAALAAARVGYGSGALEVSTAAGCTMVSADAGTRDCSGAIGVPVHGSIRSAFRVVDLARGLQVRAAVPRYATVQAIALGEEVVILSAPANFIEPASGRIVAALPAIDYDARVAAALVDVLARVGKRR